MIINMDLHLNSIVMVKLDKKKILVKILMNK